LSITSTAESEPRVILDPAQSSELRDNLLSEVENIGSADLAARLTSGQIRAARALLRWRAEDLARESAVGVATIRRAELAEHETSMTAANNLLLRRTFRSHRRRFH
jgi:hypothetical protein